ncbi:MAG TPA: ABC transporter substrate-binding protein [Trueperaceae bacterium]
MRSSHERYLAPGRLLAALLVALLAGGAASAQETIKVGFILPLTGAAAAEGIAVQEGAELAARLINEAGGVQVGGTSYTFELLFEDDQCNPQAATEASTRLIAEEVDFVGGSFCSSAALAAQPLFAAFDIPQFVYAYADDLTGASRVDSGADMSVRLGPKAFIEMAPLAKYAVVENGHTSFFAMAQNTDFGRSMVQEFQRVAESLGASFVAEPEYFQFGATDFRTLLTRARDSGADAILAIGLANEMIGITLQHDELGIELPVYGSDLLNTVAYQDAVGDLDDGFYSPWFYDDGQTQRAFEGELDEPMAVELDSAFRENVGRPAEMNNAWGWGTIHLIRQGVERAASVDAAEVMAAILSGEEFDMPFGRYGFEQCGQANMRAGVAAYSAEDGKVLVAGRDYVELDPVVLTREDLCG